MHLFGLLDLGIDAGVWPWIWLTVAVVFALIELTALAGSFILLPFAVSAFLASLTGFYDAPVEIQWLVFVLVGGLLFAGAYRWARRYSESNPMPAGVGADRLVGQVGIVTEAISPDDTARRGRVSVGGEDWGALTEQESAIEKGRRVYIVAMKGTRVVVRTEEPGDVGEGEAG